VREAAKHVRGYAQVLTGAARLRLAGAADLAWAATAIGRTPDQAAWTARIERLRRELLASDAYMPRPDRTLGEAVARAATQPPWTDFLYRLVRRLQPHHVVEMGTFVGLSAAYLGAALHENGRGRLITLDADEQAVAIAEQNFAALGLGDVLEARVGSFSDTLERALVDMAPVDLLFVDGHHQEEPTLTYFRTALPYLSSGATVLFDDIRWSGGMRRAWSTISHLPEVIRATDLVKMGVVAVREQEFHRKA
jgi:predicted O-methyltransferase YrrM